MATQPKKARKAKAKSRKAAVPAKTRKVQAVEKGPRHIKEGHYKSFRLAKRIKTLAPPLPGAFSLFRQSLGLLNTHRRLFLGITAVFAGLNILLVRGIGGGLDLAEYKLELQDSLGGQANGLITGTNLFGYLLFTFGGSSSDTGNVYQVFLVVLVSLVLIWALRQVLAGKNLRVREAYYNGTYPLIPFILVLIVVGLELLPLLIGSWLYGVTVGGGIAIHGVEKLAWATVFFLSAILSLYMVCSSLFALYIVTLPAMTPMKALRSARQLVLHRRWMVMRKILFLPLVLLVLMLIIMLPFLIFATPVAEWVFFILSMGSLTIAHSYMYNLYRSLL